MVDGIDKVIISGDLVATDAYCGGIMAQHDDSFQLSSIQTTLQTARDLGMGTADLDQVEIIEITA